MNERQKWLADIKIAGTQTFSKMDGIYNDPTKPAVRPGADDHQQYPSLRGTSRHYLDGRVEKVKR